MLTTPPATDVGAIAHSPISPAGARPGTVTAPHGTGAISAAAAAHRPGNNFDALRLFGALLVTVSHAFHFLGGGEPLGAATGNQSLGGLGLNLFCVISGYLITRSRQRRAIGEFTRARFQRLVPGLAVATLALAFVVGPLVTELSLGAYVRSPQLYRFLTTVFILPLNERLPGVLGGASLNGPLYSLTAEVLFYVFVGMLGGRKFYPWIAGLAFVATAAVFLRNDYATLPFSTLFQVETHELTLFHFPARLSGLCIYYLLAGSLLALVNFETSPLRRGWPLLVALWLVALGVDDRRVYDAVEMLVFPLIVLGIGTERGFVVRIDERLGDISYGTYVYHYVVIQVLVGLGLPFGLEAGPIGLVVLATVVSCVCGWLSYHLVEKRFVATSK